MNSYKPWYKRTWISLIISLTAVVLILLTVFSGTMIILGSNSTSNDINFVILTGVGIVLSLLSLFLACVSSLSSTDQLNRPSVELDNVHTSDSEQTEQEPTSQVQELKVEQTSLGLQNYLNS